MVIVSKMNVFLCLALVVMCYSADTADLGFMVVPTGFVVSGPTAEQQKEITKDNIMTPGSRMHQWKFIDKPRIEADFLEPVPLAGKKLYRSCDKFGAYPEGKRDFEILTGETTGNDVYIVPFLDNRVKVQELYCRSKATRSNPKVSVYEYTGKDGKRLFNFSNELAKELWNYQETEKGPFIFRAFLSGAFGYKNGHGQVQRSTHHSPSKKYLKNERHGDPLFYIWMWHNLHEFYDGFVTEQSNRGAKEYVIFAQLSPRKANKGGTITFEIPLDETYEFEVDRYVERGDKGRARRHGLSFGGVHPRPLLRKPPTASSALFGQPSDRSASLFEGGAMSSSSAGRSASGGRRRPRLSKRKRDEVEPDWKRSDDRARGIASMAAFNPPSPSEEQGSLASAPGLSSPWSSEQLPQALSGASTFAESMASSTTAASRPMTPPDGGWSTP